MTSCSMGFLSRMPAKDGESRLTKSHESNLYILSLRKYAHGVEHTLLQIVNTAQDLQKGSYLSQVTNAHKNY